MSLRQREMLPGIWHIGDDNDNFCTLIVGETGAILFDTTMGFDDLKGCVAAITPHEPIVICSHNHFDHVGGGAQFDRVYLHPAELPMLDLAAGRVPTLEVTLKTDLSHATRFYRERERILPIEPGTVIDLGGKTVEVIPMPGHTPGSIGLLCREDQLLLAGDTLSPQCCVFFRESLPLSVCRDTVKSLWELEFDRFLSSHFDFLFPRKILEKFEACFDLPGKKRGMDYEFPPLPGEKGKFLVLELCDPTINQLIGLAVKEEDAPAPPKKQRTIK